MTIQQLKIAESELQSLLFEWKNLLWKCPLSDDEKEEIESRWNLLEKTTHNTFKERYDNYKNPKTNVGNI